VSATETRPEPTVEDFLSDISETLDRIEKILEALRNAAEA